MFKEKFEALYQMYIPIFEIYNGEGTSEIQKSFIETTLGASIFYLPHPVDESWTNIISKNALTNRMMFVTDTMANHNNVKDHICSRKRAAKLTLNRATPFSQEEFMQDFLTVYRMFAYVTSAENRLLVNWHENDLTSSVEDYIQVAGNHDTQLFNLNGIRHNQLNSFCRFLGMNNFEFTQDSINTKMDEFLNSNQ